jgi:hypothetical protein
VAILDNRTLKEHFDQAFTGREAMSGTRTAPYSSSGDTGRGSLSSLKPLAGIHSSAWNDPSPMELHRRTFTENLNHDSNPRSVDIFDPPFYLPFSSKDQGMITQFLLPGLFSATNDHGDLQHDLPRSFEWEQSPKEALGSFGLVDTMNITDYNIHADCNAQFDFPVLEGLDNGEWYDDLQQKPPRDDNSTFHVPRL